MPSNTEVKARLRDPERLGRRAAERAGSQGELLHQVDTFFHVPAGRLKLREETSGQSEVIYYRRADHDGPALCDYVRVPIGEPELLKELLAAALGIRGVVHKCRRLYLVGQTRVHIDEVASLVMFLELEVDLGSGKSAAEGGEIAFKLLRELDIADGDLVGCAYIDLLSSPTR